MTKREAAEAVAAARHAVGVTWAELAEIAGRPEVWTTAALLGQHPVPPPLAERLAERLGLGADVVTALTRQPYRGSPDEVLQDPTIYRLQEIVLVYGPAIKELIHEKCGDGIMSAINFSLDVEREDRDGEARIVITMDGKYLPYEW